MLFKNWNVSNFINESFLRLDNSPAIKKCLVFSLVIIVGIFSISLAYRELILNSFTKLPGDRYDMVIMSSILEHWKNFWSGNATWHDVGYFYPYTRTIAQTDGYFLIGVIFSIIRFFSNDIFISVVATTIALSGIGYFSLFFLTRKMLMFRIETSLLLSSTFVVFSSIVSHNQRLQLMSLYLLPILTSFLIFYVRAVLQRNSHIKTTISGCLFGLFYGAMTITCFYVAWFYALFLMISVIVFLLLRTKLVFEWMKSFLSLRMSSLIVFLVFLISLFPFAWAYYPKSLEVGVRNYASVAGNLILPLELIQVGFDNYLYSGVLNHVFNLFYPGYKPWGEYYNVGFSPSIFLLFIASLFSFIKKSEVENTDLFLLTGLSTLICCFIVVKFGGFSLWYYVYSFVPGAKALNAVSVFLMVLVLPVLIVVGKFIELQHFRKPFFAIFASFIILGELTTPYINFDRKLESNRIADIPLPPATCHVFYVSGLNGQKDVQGFPEWVNSMYAHNVTAMIISQLIRMPTVNGIASFNPPDWNFAAPWDEGYDQRVLTYSKKHNVQNLCKLDLNKKIWIETKDLSY